MTGRFHIELAAASAHMTVGEEFAELRARRRARKQAERAALVREIKGRRLTEKDRASGHALSRRAMVSE